MKQILLQFTAGKGPKECQWAVAQIVKIFLKEMRQMGMDVVVIDQRSGEEATLIQSVVVSINGEVPSTLVSEWQGTLLYQASSPFRPNHKRKNWYVACHELGTLEDSIFDKRDVQCKAIKSSGAGGQNVNKVNTAIQAKHLPTGIQVTVMNARSQMQNKKIAMQRLGVKVLEYHQQAQSEKAQEEWQQHHSLERGNPTRVFTSHKKKCPRKSKNFKGKRQELKNDLRKQLE